MEGRVSSGSCAGLAIGWWFPALLRRQGAVGAHVDLLESLSMQSREEPIKLDRKRADKLTKLWSIINGLVASEFTGYLKINFTQGRLGRIEKNEEILKK